MAKRISVPIIFKSKMVAVYHGDLYEYLYAKVPVHQS